METNFDKPLEQTIGAMGGYTLLASSGTGTEETKTVDNLNNYRFLYAYMTNFGTVNLVSQMIPTGLFKALGSGGMQLIYSASNEIRSGILSYVSDTSVKIKSHANGISVFLYGIK